MPRPHVAHEGVLAAAVDVQLQVFVPGLVLDKAERRRLTAKACEAAAHRAWRDDAGASSGEAEAVATKAAEAPAQAEPRRAA